MSRTSTLFSNAPNREIGVPLTHEQARANFIPTFVFATSFHNQTARSTDYCILLQREALYRQGGPLAVYFLATDPETGEDIPNAHRLAKPRHCDPMPLPTDSHSNLRNTEYVFNVLIDNYEPFFKDYRFSPDSSTHSIIEWALVLCDGYDIQLPAATILRLEELRL